MTFTASALVLAWVAILLLALGLAGLLRQVSLLTRQLETGAPGTTGAPSARAVAGAGARTTRELIGFTAPMDVVDRVRHDGADLTVVAFVAPGCSSCTMTLGALAADPLLADGRAGLTIVSTGSCGPATADADGVRRLCCVSQGRDLLDRLAVPATPYLLVLDPDGVVRAATLPDEDTDLGAWLRRAGTPAPLTVEETSR
ncbi:hypothetical protein [Ornithinimicrobium pratense]|uniref:Thioredoxin domain-containing protein n=1 Tax=Ornithinimicrobium pratense TaxID=2593973 RepID=A0A5J6V1H6_9MICO|nr:hypothetical protein [Ornithinimicrobium pratense]QFG67417.1 hypothetical protein FY030_00585 [Ornithinimicrobium pratense]